MFGKPLSGLTPDDIHRLCEEQVRESDVVEFKEALSGRGGPDGWHTGASSIGSAARDKIVNEIVAFANAHGGTLVLGIAETKDKPARAREVAVVPRCAELAERLSRALADTVEPPLTPYPQIVPVPIDGDAGVVILQIPASRNAPHRHRTNLDSYIRRGEQAVPMTMREIQDLTLQLDRGLASLERRFRERAEAVASWSDVLLLRATAIPLVRLEIPGVPGDAQSYPTLHEVQADFRTGARTRVEVPTYIGSWRPILRGIQSAISESGGKSRFELHRDGLVELVLSAADDEQLMLFPGWILGMVCNLLIATENARQMAASGNIEYALELAVRTRRPLRVGGYLGTQIHRGWGPIDPPGCVFPRYSVGDRSTFGALLDLIQRDFWNAAGHDLPEGQLLKFHLEPFYR